MINHVFTSFSAVQIYDLSYIHLHFFIIDGYITNSQHDHLPGGLIAQLVEHCIDNAEVMGSVRIPFRPDFFQALIS